MIVYDFDRSIYGGTPTKDFFLFCLFRRWQLWSQLSPLLWYFLCCAFGERPWADYWGRLYTVLYSLEGRDDLCKDFWAGRLGRLHRPDQTKNVKILCTTPDFLIQPLATQMGVSYLAARYHNGAFFAMRDGRERRNCVLALLGDTPLQGFYGAGFCDHDLALEAEVASYRRHGRQEPWEAFIAKAGRRRGLIQPWISPEFFRFWCVGWLNMGAAWGLEAFWGLFLPANLGFSVGYAMSLLVSFALNSCITFRRKMTFRRLLAYVVSYLPNFVVQFFTVFVLHNLLHWPYLLTCFLAAVVGTPVTFLCLKYLAFRHKDGED